MRCSAQARWVWIFLGLLYVSGGRAYAAPDCEELDEQDFLTLLSQGQAAADQSDVETHRSRVDEIRARIPCLSFAPRPRNLADFFVMEALRDFTVGEPWEDAMRAALSLRPTVDRFVGGAHPMARFELDPVSDEPAVGQELSLPSGAAVYIDGELVGRLPPPAGRHLVQVTREGRWRSTLTRGGLPDRSFFTDAIAAPLAWTTWGHASLSVGPGGVDQRKAEAPEAGAPVWTPDQHDVVVWPGLELRGAVSRGAFGVSGQVSVGLVGGVQPLGNHAQASLTVGSTRVRAGLGAGVAGSLHLIGSTPTIDDGEEADWARQPAALPYASVVGLFVSRRADAGVTLGVGSGALRMSGFAGLVTEPGALPLPVRFGISGSALQTSFRGGTVAVPDDFETLTWRTSLEVGVPFR